PYDYLLFSYRRTDLAKNDRSTTIKVEWDTDLAGPWADASSTANVVIVEENDGFEAGVDRVKVYLPLSLAANGRLFARLGVSIDAPSLNAPPVAENQAVNVNEDASVLILLGASDPNSDPLGFTVTSQPMHGTLSGSGPNRTYTPAANYSGTDSFTFMVSDGVVASAPATVSINVRALQEFDQWMAPFGISAGPGENSDSDSIINAVEYVIGGNPGGGSDAQFLPTATLVSADLNGVPGNEDYLRFTYRRTHVARDDAATTIQVEWSTSLAGNWTNTVGMTQQVSTGDGVDLVNVFIPRALAIGGRLFARLGVSVVWSPADE
ncbi:MAG: hypothetical protein RLZZ214_628, partial [Verrucomicrobiota bacterium]